MTPVHRKPEIILTILPPYGTLKGQHFMEHYCPQKDNPIGPGIGELRIPITPYCSQKDQSFMDPYFSQNDQNSMEHHCPQKY